MKSKKNIKSILIIAIIGIFSLIFFNKSFAANTAKVIVETANIRKEADANSTILEQVSQDQEVEIIEKLGDWYKIKYKGIEGYLRKDLLNVNQDEIQNTEKQETSKPENATDATVTKNETVENETGRYKVIDTTNLKIMPLINSSNIKELSKDLSVNVLEINNKWALVEIDSNRGWVIFSKLQKQENQAQVTTPQEQEAKPEQKPEETANEQTTETKPEENKPTVTEKNVTMYVNSTVINLRKEETTESESLAKLNKGTEVTVISESSNGWSKVKVNGTEGYISTKLLSTTKPEVVTSRSLEEARKEVAQKEENKVAQATTTTTTQSTEGTSKGSQVVATAKKYLGCKYVYGGTSPSGFDCSGFTQYVYKQNGVTLNRTSDAQASNGTAVSKSNLKAGDLVIFTGHVGIYIGNNQFIHAANPSKGVIITSLSDSYYVKNYKTARRIFN